MFTPSQTTRHLLTCRLSLCKSSLLPLPRSLQYSLYTLSSLFEPKPGCSISPANPAHLKQLGPPCCHYFFSFDSSFSLNDSVPSLQAQPSLLTFKISTLLPPLSSPLHHQFQPLSSNPHLQAQPSLLTLPISTLLPPISPVSPLRSSPHLQARPVRLHTAPLPFPAATTIHTLRSTVNQRPRSI
jgi:hypothetical protein